MKGDHFEDLGVDGRIILKWILNKSVGRSWTELIWLRIGRSGWLFRTGNKFDVQVTVHRDKCLQYEFHSDPARKLSANLYDIHHCCVYSEKLLMMDRGTVRNMQSCTPKINLRN